MICALYRSNQTASDKGCCVGVMALRFNGRCRIYGLQLSAEPHRTKPRPIGVLVMVAVEELRDPAACIPTVRQALDCSRSCRLARSVLTAFAASVYNRIRQFPIPHFIRHSAVFSVSTFRKIHIDDFPHSAFGVLYITIILPAIIHNLPLSQPLTLGQGGLLAGHLISSYGIIYQ